ncbi:hypothetical protein M1O20_01505 [Dehalococcoidia bacterium]|nr:hypothetical protein [Dehalococcoidia bacterium]
MKSVHFAISSGSRMPEAEYLPRLVLNVHRSKKGGGLFKKSAEIVRGIAELAIPVLISFYARRGRGIVILHEALAQKKILSFPEIVVHDLESLEKTFARAETDYDEFIRGLSTLVASIAEVKEHTRAFESLPGKQALDDLRELLGSVFETESTDVFLFDTDSFEQNKEVEEIHQMLECEEDKLSSLPSHLDDIQELITQRSQLLIANLSEECEKTMVMRNKKRREMIDAFKIKAAEIKQLKRDNDEDEENLLSDRMGRRKTVEHKIQQLNKQLSSTSGEVERLKDSITECKNQLVDIDKAIREIKERAANRRTELHNQLLALDEQVENFDNETESIRYEFKEKMQSVERLLERFMAAKEAYIINAKNALTDRINELSISLPLPGVAEDAQGSFLVYIPAFVALFKDEKAGTQRFMIFPPNSVTEESKSLASSLLAKFSGGDHREGLDALFTENLTNRLMSDRELELALLGHISSNSILGSSSRKRSVIANGADTLRIRERISEKEFAIIKGMMEVER